jgi:hypothetical protein
MAEWTGQPTWLDAPASTRPAPDESTVRKRLAAILGSTHDAPANDAAPFRPERGVIVPWPGTGRAAPPLDTASVSPTLAGDSVTVTPPTDASEQPTSPASPAPSATSELDALFAEVAPYHADGGGAEAIGSPYVDSWPIPAGFLGEAVAGHDASLASALPAAFAPPMAGADLTTFHAEPCEEIPDTLPAPTESIASESVIEVADKSAGGDSSGPRSALRAYEASLLRAITGTLRAIEDRLAGGMAGHPAAPLPAPAERSAALTALDGLVTAGELPAPEAEVHRALLLAAGEAGPRLRSLLELRDAGYLPDAELDRKRREIVGPLAALLTR